MSANPAPPVTTGSPKPSALTGLSPLVAIVFCGFLSVGAPLPALSLYVHDELGFSLVTVGWVIGLQSLTTVLTRHRSGTLCDHRGPRHAVLLGLPIAVMAGVLYLLSALVPAPAGIRLAILLAGRVALGLGESLFITGTMAWGIARIGAARTGLVMSWQGIALYAAFGIGAPLGLAVQGLLGFKGVAALTIAMPILAGLIALALPAAGLPHGDAPGARRRPVVHVPMHHVVALIWRPGAVVALAVAPFAAMGAFLALDYAARGWSGPGLALLAFGTGYVLVRLVGSHWPDRYGGVRVASISIAIEACGQALLWLAPNAVIATAAAFITGVGFSLVFPSMGVEATRRVPPELRGRAVGNFIAFFDVALGLTGPIVGIVAGRFSYAAAFLVGFATCILALGLVRTVRPAA